MYGINYNEKNKMNPQGPSYSLGNRIILPVLYNLESDNLAKFF